MPKLFMTLSDDYRTGKSFDMYDIDGLIDHYNSIDSDNETEYNEKTAERRFNNEESRLEIIDLEDTSHNNKYLLYLVYGDGCGSSKVILVKKIRHKSNIQRYLDQVYSDINESQPFVVTGMTPGYREEGYYPDALPLINGKSMVKEKYMDDIEDSYYCAAFIMHNNSLYQSMLVQ